MTGPDKRLRLGDRSAFPELAAVAYLNHASVSPLSDPVARAVESMVQALRRDGIGAVLQAAARVDGFRKKVGLFLGTSADNVAFVANTTGGITFVALSIPWEKRDRVIVFEDEFPANVTPWRQAADLFDLELVVVPAAPFRRSLEEGLAAFERALGAGVRLVAVSLVAFQTGFRLPVEALAARAHRAGGELLVDGIQGLGVVPFHFDNSGVDYLAAGGHKWLMGLQGGGLLLARRAATERFVPRAFGWMSHENAFDFLTQGGGLLSKRGPFKRTAAVFEGGSPAWLSYQALEASLDVLATLGVDNIFAHVQRYHDALEPLLEARGFVSQRAIDTGARSGSLCFLPPEDVALPALVAALSEAGIMVSMPDGFLRFAPHWPNNLSEIPAVVSAVERALSR